MTPRQRVEIALRGGRPDVVPFTIYANKLPRCQIELDLRNLGACILERSPSVFRTHSPNVHTKSLSYAENGAHYLKTWYETPEGTLETVNRPQPGTTWHVRRMFTGPEDYRAIISLVNDRLYEENFAEFIRARERYGEGSFLRASIGYSPLLEIIYTIMGVEQFSVEWAERRDDVMKLYDALTEERRRLYRVLAGSPALATNYGGNVTPEIVGIERFRDLVLPHYNEAAEFVHRAGGLIGVHFDGNTKALAPLIGESDLDYIEAFTPPPDCDMTVAEARKAWPDKVVWINFPSSLHLSGVSTVEETTREILREAAPGDGFLFGITEDVPDDAWPETFPAIARVIAEDGRTPL